MSAGLLAELLNALGESFGALVESFGRPTLKLSSRSERKVGVAVPVFCNAIYELGVRHVSGDIAQARHDIPHVAATVALLPGELYTRVTFPLTQPLRYSRITI